MNRSPSSQEIWGRPFVKAHEEWCGDFVLELRLRDVPGPVIGERLAEVEGHCAETGESPSEAFGNPTEYAARLDQDSDPDRISGVWVVATAGAAQVLAMLIGTSAVPAWVHDEPLTYNLGQILCFGLVSLLLLSLPLLLRPMLRHPFVLGGSLVTVVLLGAGGAALSDRSDLPTIAQLPAPLVAVGLFLTVLALAWVEYRELTRNPGGDLVTSPLDARPGQSTTPDRRGRRAALLPSCLIPAAYLAFATLGWLLA
ncbi:hypothetical protein [Agromyces badenianii]|uniref:hypothetical protein n=1 Tax=Agromyces badenianii TaxID=2080742 RepID=UPI0011B24222|nr:hypothetical protein [Agromyces badenianii]